MPQYDILDAPEHFPDLVDLALQGEEVVISREGKSLVKLVPLVEGSRKRVPGFLKEHIDYIADDFDAPMDGFEDHED